MRAVGVIQKTTTASNPEIGTFTIQATTTSDETEFAREKADGWKTLHLSMSVAFAIRNHFRDLAVEALGRMRRWDHPVRIACTRVSAGNGGRALTAAQKWLSTNGGKQTNSSWKSWQQKSHQRIILSRNEDLSMWHGTGNIPKGHGSLLYKLLTQAQRHFLGMRRLRLSSDTISISNVKCVKTRKAWWSRSLSM